MTQIKDSELILHTDGSLYHLHLHPEQVAPTIITVGDPDRVKMISQHFDRIEFQVQNREFVTHTGYIGKKRLTVIATGIGTDNVDIVMNELDALFNIDLPTKVIKKDLTRLQFIRIGTSGGIRKDLPVDTLLVSKYAIGLDALMHYYQFPQTNQAYQLQLAIKLRTQNLRPYVVAGDEQLLQQLGKELLQGITITAPGFYAPQARHIRTSPKQGDFLQSLQKIDTSTIAGLPITNLEMETAGIYGLSKALGHSAISFNALLANRMTGEFSQQASKTVRNLVELVLERIEGI